MRSGKGRLIVGNVDAVEISYTLASTAGGRDGKRYRGSLDGPESAIFRAWREGGASLETAEGQRLSIIVTDRGAFIGTPAVD